MPKRIYENTNPTFRALELEVGEPFLLVNDDREFPSPLILGRFARLEEGHRPGGIALNYCPRGLRPEEWTIHTIGRALRLFSPTPEYDSKNVITKLKPHFDEVRDGRVGKDKILYCTEMAYAGRKEILRALENEAKYGDMPYYAQAIQFGRLIIERTGWKRRLEEVGLVLPNVPRFR